MKTGKKKISYMDLCCRNPWQVMTEPFKMAKHVYYVSGNNWVAAYLLDSGEGLILIDTGMTETLYLLTESIRKLGFDPADIKMILLSHGHRDHFGGLRPLQALTGAKVYMSKEDYRFMKEYPQLVFHGNYTLGTFEPDVFYNADIPVELGRFRIKTMLTPGHTPGTTSFFFDAEDWDGRMLHCGMHGGIGLNTLTNEYLETGGLPKTLRTEFIHSLDMMKDMEIDLCLPSHTNQYEILSLVPEIREDNNPFVNPEIWGSLMRKRLTAARELGKQE